MPPLSCPLNGGSPVPCPSPCPLSPCSAPSWPSVPPVLLPLWRFPCPTALPPSWTVSCPLPVPPSQASEGWALQSAGFVSPTSWLQVRSLYLEPTSPSAPEPFASGVPGRFLKHAMSDCGWGTAPFSLRLSKMRNGDLLASRSLKKHLSRPVGHLRT